MTEICHPEWITVTADGSAHKGYDQVSRETSADFRLRADGGLHDGRLYAKETGEKGNHYERRRCGADA